MQSYHLPLGMQMSAGRWDLMYSTEELEEVEEVEFALWVDMLMG